ncbi:hypothetical protein E2C01_039342 [Portunus trituberculatus]|uniref:Uncharacterized protein n=1 Tax=Portunus trituberculatus TaxID=210409 RepID=A0A5B7FJF3_PORTR|nr:hypothetical protein [Portunus trituberculatus]
MHCLISLLQAWEQETANHGSQITPNSGRLAASRSPTQLSAQGSRNQNLRGKKGRHEREVVERGNGVFRGLSCLLVSKHITLPPHAPLSPFSLAACARPHPAPLRPSLPLTSLAQPLTSPASQ